MHAIVPAGGAGTRLWPLSRRDYPKYLLPLGQGGASLLRQTVTRLGDLAESATVVTDPRQVAAVTRGLRDVGVPVRVLAEPSPRNSMPAIGWAAALIEARYGDQAVVGSFAADHVIGDEGAFRHVVAAACAAAAAGYICTVGITPTRPATGYGYIRAGRDIPGLDARRVEEFTEKPGLADARAWVEGGRHLWNAGMFVARATVLLDQLALDHPALAQALRRLARATVSAGADGERAALGELWPRMESIAIDYALAEPAAARGQVAVVRAGDIGWCDVGDYRALRGYGRDQGQARTLGPVTAYAQDSPGAFVGADPQVAGEVVAVLGVPDAIAVRAPGVTLFTTAAHAHRVAQTLAELRRRGLVP